MSEGVVVALIAGGATLGTALIALAASLLSEHRKLDANTEQLHEIHVLVNSRLTEALTEIRVLKDALVHQGVDPEHLEDS